MEASGCRKHGRCLPVAANRKVRQKQKTKNSTPRLGGWPSRTIFVQRAEAVGPEKKRALIKRGHPELSIGQQRRLARLSRSAFYSTPVGVDADTLAVMKEIDRVFTRTRSSAAARSLPTCGGKEPLSGVVASGR